VQTTCEEVTQFGSKSTWYPDNSTWKQEYLDNSTWKQEYPAVLRIRDVYSGSRIPDPDFLPIPDLGSRIQKQQQKRGVKKKFVVKPFFVAPNFTKLKIILFFKC
jgi:hypothetical protein